MLSYSGIEAEWVLKNTSQTGSFTPIVTPSSTWQSVIQGQSSSYSVVNQEQNGAWHSILESNSANYSQVNDAQGGVWAEAFSSQSAQYSDVDKD